MMRICSVLIMGLLAWGMAGFAAENRGTALQNQRLDRGMTSF